MTPVLKNLPTYLLMSTIKTFLNNERKSTLFSHLLGQILNYNIPNLSLNIKH